MKKQRIILLIGNDPPLSYLLGRFAERSGYEVAVSQDHSPLVLAAALSPDVIVFLSTEILETSQALVGELVNLEIPILVCSSIADEPKARQLGADLCLLHPLVHADFHAAIRNAAGRSRSA